MAGGTTSRRMLAASGSSNNTAAIHCTPQCLRCSTCTDQLAGNVSSLSGHTRRSLTPTDWPTPVTRSQPCTTVTATSKLSSQRSASTSHATGLTCPLTSSVTSWRSTPTAARSPSPKTLTAWSRLSVVGHALVCPAGSTSRVMTARRAIPTLCTTPRLAGRWLCVLRATRCLGVASSGLTPMTLRPRVMSARTNVSATSRLTLVLTRPSSRTSTTTGTPSGVHGGMAHRS